MFVQAFWKGLLVLKPLSYQKNHNALISTNRDFSSFPIMAYVDITLSEPSTDVPARIDGCECRVDGLVQMFKFKFN